MAPGDVALQLEVARLREENADLTAKVESLEADMSSLWKELSLTIKRVSKMERVKPSSGSLEHLDRLEFEIKKRNVPGVTFKAAAEILGIDRSSVSKLSGRMKEDPRFAIRVHGKKKIIELL